MKAISIWQPWATLIAIGAKGIETRGWYTPYRGTLAIHASKRGLSPGMMRRILEEPAVRAALASGARPTDGALLPLPETLQPLGAIVATAELVACEPTDVLEEHGRLDEPRAGPAGSWCERDLGDFTSGRFGWVLARVQPLACPIQWAGSQGLFEVPSALVAASAGVAGSCVERGAAS